MSPKAIAVAGLSAIAIAASGCSGESDAEAEFTNLDLKSLRRSSTSAGSFAAGRVAGRLKLAAPNLRSWNDLAGSFAARMSDTQPAATPAYDRVLTLLTGLGGQAMTFNTGTVKGTVGGGRTRIDDLQLVAQRARIAGSGFIRHDGGLDFDLVGYTGATNVANRARDIAVAQLLTAANPAFAVVSRVNRLLSDRVVAVKVTGSVSAPVTQMKPGPTLTAEAARFLLGEFLPQDSVLAP